MNRYNYTRHSTGSSLCTHNTGRIDSGSTCSIIALIRHHLRNCQNDHVPNSASPNPDGHFGWWKDRAFPDFDFAWFRTGFQISWGRRLSSSRIYTSIYSLENVIVAKTGHVLRWRRGLCMWKLLSGKRLLSSGLVRCDQNVHSYSTRRVHDW
jgi:hypothetical protein